MGTPLLYTIMYASTQRGDPYFSVHPTQLGYRGGTHMSSIKITDKGGGKYEAVIEFSYGECERLPFNILRRIHARLKTVPGAGLLATADFNIRIPGESGAFLEMLDLFGAAGSFPHGSAADPDALTLGSAPKNQQLFDGDDDLEVEGTLNDY